MKKIKVVLFSFLALFVVSLSVVGANAEEEERYGTYTVSNEGKKAVWDFTKNTPSSAYTINTVSDSTVYGIGGNSEKVRFKTQGCLSNGDADSIASIYVPVPSADADGSISFTGNDDARYVFLTDATVDANKMMTLKNGNNAKAFTASDVKTKEGHYYLELVGTTAGKEAKIKDITVTLTTGAYEVPLTFTANIYQQEGTKDDTT
ncbi:MAG: hypothetical protein NC087_07975, partial [Anaeroplasma bactoclasticum]|nr:hypothetical protein [Anaeroplasma bactoclasticum]